MKILLTGANGYIGTRLLQRLIQDGHHIYTMVRSASRFNPPPQSENNITIVEGDILDPLTLKNFPKDFEAAYFLIHSMSQDATNFDLKDRIAAENFLDLMEGSSCKQVIYLSGIVNDEKLSKHLNSRYEVEKILKKGKVPLTCLRAAIIIGAGSASFEIIRDLVEKLPFMIAPKWLNSQCQPISIVDVIDYLAKVLNNKNCLNQSFDIGGPNRLNYKDMLLRFAKVRGLKRYILIVPVLTPKLSSMWLFFVTSTSFDLAKALVDSLRNDAICIHQCIEKIIPKKCLTYEESIERAFQKIDDHEVLSSWKDSWSGSNLPAKYNEYVKVPTHGCLFWEETRPISKECSCKNIMNHIYNLGGDEGYFVNWAWKLRGLVDRWLGGVGLRRGKVARKKPRQGDALDFWRVLLVDDENMRFLLYAEMIVPGEAWLELKINQANNDKQLVIKATFRPKGLWGRIYWYSLWPIHFIIFKGLANRIIKESVAC